MTDREIKFRVWDNVDYMSTSFTLFDLQSKKIQFTSDIKIMQFTGLKDKNGNEIYEGDMLKCIDHPVDLNSGNHSVQFLQGAFMAGDSFLTDWGTAWIEIIGNIYENPELLLK